MSSFPGLFSELFDDRVFALSFDRSVQRVEIHRLALGGVELEISLFRFRVRFRHSRGKLWSRSTALNCKILFAVRNLKPSGFDKGATEFASATLLWCCLLAEVTAS